jgi:hypothetical protein
MTYIRHRPRMVRQSVYEDIRELLAVLEWTGESEDDVLGMLSSPILLKDYFPVNAVYQGEEVDINTLAIDQGTPSEPVYAELGSEAREQEYVFNIAFFAENDAVALSLFSDLSDRYKGNFRAANMPAGFPPHFTHESVALYNYLDEPPTPVVDMDVLSFEVAKSPEQPAPGRLLWFAELTVVDFMETGN